MTKISSKSTFWFKRVFPLLWFGFLAFFIAQSLMMTKAIREDFMFLIVPIVMAFFGYFFMKKMVWDLADEVFDCGDSLLVRHRGKEDNVLLSNVMNLSASQMMNPPRITLRLVKVGKFGSEISFSPAGSPTLNPFAKNQIVEDLILRVDKARMQRLA